MSPKPDQAVRCLALFLFSIAPVTIAMGQRPVVLGTELDVPPVIDGVVNSEEWSKAAAMSGFTVIADGKPEPFSTRAQVGYDASFIYIAFVCNDPDPTLIRATEYRRGMSLDGDDRVHFVINPFYTQRGDDFSRFEVSAGGGTRSNIAGGRATKREWEGDWEAKARITSEGYEVEIRIPWEILPLPSGGVRNIDVNFGRYYQRHQLLATYANIGPEERHDRHAIWSNVRVPVITRREALQALPYQVVGYDSETRNVVFNTGVDWRYRINSQLTALGTINPDFQNVENAVLGLEFSRFERLADERRPFFVEGGDYFRMGGSARAFASQRIGQFDVGGKVFGKLSDNSQLGALVTMQFDHSVNAVVRYKNTFGTRSSLTAGWAISDREDTGIVNSVGNLELMLDGERWGVGVIHAFTEDSDVGAGRRTDVDVFYHDDALRGHVGWQQISPEFLPRIGFAPRRGFKGWNASLRYERAYSHGAIAEMGADISLSDLDSWDGSGVFLNQLEFEADLRLRNGFAAEASYSVSNFRGSIARFAGINVEYPDNNPYSSLQLGFVYGKVDEDSYSLIEVEGRHRFPFRLTVSAALAFEKEGGESEHLHILGSSYELSEYQSLGGRMIIRDSKANWYLSYRHSGNFGVEYYVILGDPNAQSFQRRLVVKAVIPFDLRIGR